VSYLHLAFIYLLLINNMLEIKPQPANALLLELYSQSFVFDNFAWAGS
jgi:hypothetical protein